MLRSGFSPDSFHQLQQGALPALLGIEVVALSEGHIALELEVEAHHLAPNGFLHAGSVVTLADTACGYGSISHLPEGAQNFTTVELKSNFLGTVTSGRIRADATLVHGGRTTQVWDARVSSAAGKTIALFRCTQMVLWPKA